MSYNIPTFNLTCNVWHAGTQPPAAPSATFNCNLQFALKAKVDIANLPTTPASLMYLLLPKSTDIRGKWGAANGDVVECPAGTHRFYSVQLVDDVGKGFSNEYRVAGMVQVTNPAAAFGIAFPVPLP